MPQIHSKVPELMVLLNNLRIYAYCKGQIDKKKKKTNCVNNK